jgi:type IV secretory pathway VirB2 component (pilin)
MKTQIEISVETWFWACVAVMVCFTAAPVFAAGVAIPQVQSFLETIKGTVQGPFAAAVFAAGVVKCGHNVWKHGGIEGIAEGGLGTAAAGAFLGTSGWLAGQFGITGAVIL